MIKHLLLIFLLIPYTQYYLDKVIPFLTRSTYTGSALLFILTPFWIVIRLFKPYSFFDLLVVFAIVYYWAWIESLFHEWVMHRWRGKLNITFANHAKHHADPTVYNGLMPIFPVIQLCAACWVFIDRPLLFSGLCTIIVMLCVYELVHAMIHAGYASKGLTDHHLAHHRDWRSRFNVTSTLR